MQSRHYVEKLLLDGLGSEKAARKKKK